MSKGNTRAPSDHDSRCSRPKKAKVESSTFFIAVHFGKIIFLIAFEENCRFHSQLIALKIIGAGKHSLKNKDAYQKLGKLACLEVSTQ